jgi:hypothetical protein
MFSFFCNALPKIKALARTMIVIGNFALELFHVVSKVVAQGRSAYNAAATTA